MKPLLQEKIYRLGHYRRNSDPAVQGEVELHIDQQLLMIMVGKAMRAKSAQCIAGAFTVKFKQDKE